MKSRANQSETARLLKQRILNAVKESHLSLLAMSHDETANVFVVNDPLAFC